MFRLRFSEDDIAHWSARYRATDDLEVESIGAAARVRGYYMHDELLIMCRWSTPRSRPLISSNDPATVERLTRAALATYREEVRMEMLTTLRGVSYPSATMLLHFA